MDKAELPRISDQLGSKSETFRESVPASRIEAFYRAVGVEPRSEAPPTFMTVFRKGEFTLFERLGIPLARVLHGEQEYDLAEPIRGGDEVSYVTELVTALEKRGSKGRMLFMTCETAVSILREGRAMSAGSARCTVVVK